MHLIILLWWATMINRCIDRCLDLAITIIWILINSWKHRNGIIDLLSASIHRLINFHSSSSSTPSSPHHSTVYPHLPFTSSSSLSISSVFLLIIVIGIHYRHWYFFSSSSFFLSVSLDFSSTSYSYTFSCQMPSKRAKLSLETIFFMRYSEICIIGGCLICGVYQ